MIKFIINRPGPEYYENVIELSEGIHFDHRDCPEMCSFGNREGSNFPSNPCHAERHKKFLITQVDENRPHFP